MDFIIIIICLAFLGKGIWSLIQGEKLEGWIFLGIGAVIGVAYIIFSYIMYLQMLAWSSSLISTLPSWFIEPIY